MTLTKPLFETIVNLLLPHMSSTDQRQALLQSALFGCPVLNQINWTGAAHAFTVLTVKTLLNYGECAPGRPAVVLLLEELKQHTGVEKHKTIDEVISKYTPQGGKTMAVDAGILVGFLLEVGRWAKSELSERWKLKRQQQETDLTNKEQVEQQIPPAIQQIIAQKSPRDVEKTVELIERRRDAIHRARNAKLADGEELSRGEITQSMFEERERKHNKTIKQMLDEIESDLNDLGFDVDRG